MFAWGRGTGWDFRSLVQREVTALRQELAMKTSEATRLQSRLTSETKRANTLAIDNSSLHSKTTSGVTRLFTMLSLTQRY